MGTVESNMANEQLPDDVLARRERLPVKPAAMMLTGTRVLLRPLELDALRGDDAVETPSLIRGYLRCGAEFLGPPAFDADFNTADLPMLMTLAGLPQRHRRHFLGSDGAGRRASTSLATAS